MNYRDEDRPIVQLRGGRIERDITVSGDVAGPIMHLDAMPETLRVDYQLVMPCGSIAWDATETYRRKRVVVANKVLYECESE